jgi:hypothetical protein
MAEDYSDAEKDLLNISTDDPERIEGAQKERELELKWRRDLIASLMLNVYFRRWLMEKLAAMGTFENAFGAGPTGFPDPLATWFAAGRKSAGWDIWEEIDGIAPDLASQMRREASAPEVA